MVEVLLIKMPKNFIKTRDKPGHKEIIGETIAKLLLFRKGFNVYSRFLDVDAVDFIIRVKKEGSDAINYNEIQLKYSKYYPKNKDYWFGIQSKTFRARGRYYFMFICNDEDLIFIIPSEIIKNWLDKMLYDEKNKKWMLYIKKEQDDWVFKTKSGLDNIKINLYENNFDILISGTNF